jgi:hypothetical protein
MPDSKKIGKALKPAHVAQEIKLYKSPWRALKLMLLCSIFVVPCILLWDDESLPQWIKWMCVLFFGLGYPVGLFHLLDRRPQIILNRTGIFDRMAYRDFINWEVIDDAYMTNVHSQRFICLVLKEEFDLKADRLIKSAKLSKSLGFQALNISLGQINVNEAKLMEFIVAMSRAEDTRREHILKNNLLKA